MLRRELFEVRSVVGPPPHQNANERKRQSSSSLLAQDMQISHKMRCDSENKPSLDELAHPLGGKPESISDKRDKSVSDPMQKIPRNQSSEISMGLRKCTKAPESSTHLTECHTPGDKGRSPGDKGKSPGDKGTLDSYLKASLDDKNTTNSMLQARQQAFTKKLDLERLPKPVSAGTSKGVEGCVKQSGSHSRRFA
ncbi:hypothetical protein Bca101_044538 [Brassica carinata]